MSDRPTASELEVDIARQRDQLAQTVDQLTGKLDVRAQARQRAARLAERATTQEGSPRPEAIVALVAGIATVVSVAFLVWRRRH